MNMNRKDLMDEPKSSPLEWQVCEDETIWQQTIAKPIAEPIAKPSPRRRLLQWARRWVASILLTLTVIGGIGGWWIWHKAQVGLAEIEAEIQTAIAGESWLITAQIIDHDTDPRQDWQAQIVGDAKQLPRQAGSGELITRLQIVDLGQDWARVNMLVESLDNSTIYRQTRVYQQTPQGWIRIPPTADRWGQPRYLETAHFNLYYFSQDEKAVREMVERLDPLYTDIHTLFFPNEFGPNKLDDEKLTIHIDPARVPGELSRPTSSPDAIIVASPSATLTPTSMAQSDLLTQTLMLAIFDRLTSQANQQHEYWQLLQSSLRLWLIWEKELPLSIWREQVVNWVLWKATTRDSTYAPDFALALCNHYRLWMHSPLDIGIPITCWQQNESGMKVLAWRYAYPHIQKVTLPPMAETPAKIQEHDESSWQTTPLSWQVRQISEPTAGEVVLATMIEYVTKAFGRDRLPTLLTALPEYPNWEELIPAVFGITLVEFEDGWNDFLSERYGIAR